MRGTAKRPGFLHIVPHLAAKGVLGHMGQTEEKNRHFFSEHGLSSTPKLDYVHMVPAGPLGTSRTPPGHRQCAFRWPLPAPNPACIRASGICMLLPSNRRQLWLLAAGMGARRGISRGRCPGIGKHAQVTPPCTGAGVGNGHHHTGATAAATYPAQCLRRDERPSLPANAGTGRGGHLAQACRRRPLSLRLGLRGQGVAQ